MQKLLITTLCALALPAFAAYPEKPVRLIVPLAAGGGMDTTARSIATPLGERLGQSVVVDNRPGGGGNVSFGRKVGQKRRDLAFAQRCRVTLATPVDETPDPAGGACQPAWTHGRLRQTWR